MPRWAAVLLAILPAGCLAYNPGPGPLLPLGPLPGARASGPKFYVDLIDARPPWDRCNPAWPLPCSAHRSLFTSEQTEPLADGEDTPLLLTGQARLAVRALRLAIIDEEKIAPPADGQADGARRLGGALSFITVGLYTTW